MIAKSSAAIAAAERIRARAGARVHRLGEPDELKEEAMPKKPTEPAPYLRKLAKMDPLPKHPPGESPKKRGRKPRSDGPKFGVFDDGSVTLSLPGCKGQMVPQEAREFVAFLAKIGVKA